MKSFRRWAWNVVLSCPVFPKHCQLLAILVLWGCICLCVSYNRHCVYKPHKRCIILQRYRHTLCSWKCCGRQKPPSGYLASRPRGVRCTCRFPSSGPWTPTDGHILRPWHDISWHGWWTPWALLDRQENPFRTPILSSCWVAEPQLGRSETWDRFHVQRPHRQDRRITALLCTALGIHGLSTFGKTQELTDPQRSGRIS